MINNEELIQDADLKEFADLDIPFDDSFLNKISVEDFSNDNDCCIDEATLAEFNAQNLHMSSYQNEEFSKSDSNFESQNQNNGFNSNSAPNSYSSQNTNKNYTNFKPVNPDEVTYLNVPFSQKDDAKALGARWDGNKKRWYVPQGVALEDFSRWL
jgi:hypothetical protein